MQNPEERDERESEASDDAEHPGSERPATTRGDELAGKAEASRPDAAATPPEAGAGHAAELEADEEEGGLPPQELRAILEALIFVSPQPVTARQIGQVLAATARPEWEAALEQLKADYAEDGRGLQLVEVAGGWQITTRPEYNDWVRELLDPRTPTRLSIQALETLAVIAYKQPVTLPEIIELRGVKSGGVIKTLLEKRFIRIVGRKEVVGRPMLYGTTKDFLLHFGLRDLGELPRIEEFAEVLGEDVDVAGLKKAIESSSPRAVVADEPDVEVETTTEGEQDNSGGPPGDSDVDT